MKRDPKDPIKLKDEIKKLEDSTDRRMNIIAYYFEKRKPDLRTYGQLTVAIKRNLRPAKELIEFWDDQLLSGFSKAESATPNWVLETVVKMLTK